MSEDKKDFFEGSGPKHSFLLGLFIGIAAISFIAFVAVLVFMWNSGVKASPADSSADSDKVAAADDNQAPTAPPSEEEEVQNAPVPEVSAADHIQGPANAKVTVITYDDFECPFCGRFQQSLIKAREEYKDRVRFVFRHFPLSFHEHAQKSAEASECAAEQGKFWEYADGLFAKQDTLGDTLYTQLVSDLKLDAKKFNDCLAVGKYTQKVNDQMEAGATAGVKGTPASFINGELVSGAVPYETLKSIIDSKL
ncbi:MAG: thioredoxin domain-containing protein [Patescibacteria group bacterium]|nr:thioredoxin domain-containing protein [Patescibacteria group bacterium]MDD5490650.1 thioredoxin domain-containing protein [Patescibacteria group bacterium]